MKFKIEKLTKNIKLLLLGIAGVLCILLIIIFVKLPSKVNIVQNKSEQDNIIIQNLGLRDILKSYGLDVESIEDYKLVLSDKEYQCVLYIYSTMEIQEELNYQKNYYPKIIYENVTDNKKVYILFNEERNLYRLLVGYKYKIDEANNYIVYVTTCGSIDRTNEFHLVISDQLLEIYKKFVLKK